MLNFFIFNFAFYFVFRYYEAVILVFVIFGYAGAVFTALGFIYYGKQKKEKTEIKIVPYLIKKYTKYNLWNLAEFYINYKNSIQITTILHKLQKFYRDHKNAIESQKFCRNYRKHKNSTKSQKFYKILKKLQILQK